eukprot:TRINITY_DN1305_c0_g1_i16.p1 TRINITY_DN1305_c0_g1~~TRINITY_DN1305_c0_g1_i16.p1  ORF type:complete len:697 (-),score=162.54 TRINITY_DN1305_c0_g1_i16:579-2669(-)
MMNIEKIPSVHNTQAIGETGYEIELEPFGGGAYGSVYRAKDQDKKEVVIKKVKLSNSSINEPKILKELNHPNVVRYFDCYPTVNPKNVVDNSLNIVMEYCDEGDLSKRIKFKRESGVFFNEQEALDIFCQICVCVQYLHSNRIMHRDLKPHNIFLTNNTIKIGDFGVSCKLNGTLDETKTFVGTPVYLAPEVWKRLPYNNKSDIWALGVILFELLTLERPYKGVDDLAKRMNMVKTVFRPAFVPSIINVLSQQPNMRLIKKNSTGLQQLVKVMLSQDPSLRPQVDEILNTAIIRQHVKTMSYANHISQEWKESIFGSQFMKMMSSLQIYMNEKAKHKASIETLFTDNMSSESTITTMGYQALIDVGGKDFLFFENEAGFNPLCFAAYFGQIDRVKTLLEYSPSEYREMAEHKFGWTPLMLASHGGHLDCVKLLLDSSSPEYCEMVAKNYGCTALHVASQEGHVDCVKVLLDGGNDEYREVADKNEFSALHLASLQGHVDCVKALLDGSNSEYREMVGKKGATALIYASQEGHVDCVKVLLDGGNDEYREVADKNEFSALHLASLQGHVDCVKALLDGSNSEYREMVGKKGATALIYASQEGHVDCVEALLDGSNPEYREMTLDEVGVTALHQSCVLGHVDCVRALLDGSRPGYREMSNKFHVNALLIASIRGFVDCLKTLLKDSYPEYREIKNEVG